MEAESDMAIYELANFGARADVEVEFEFTDMEDSALNEISIEFGDEAARQETDDKLINAYMSNTEDYVPVVNEGSRIIDGIIAQCQYGPIDLNQRSLVANIPDSVYKVHTEGWSKSTGAYVQEGANAKRCNGYYVYHMPDVMSKNVLNYAMRFENLVNYNYSSQTFICSFIITNNIWVQYIQSDNKVYIFDDRDSNARITVKGTSYLKSGTANGYFTHFEESSIVQASRQARITKGVLGTVPKLGAAIDIAERAFSDTELRTGAKHPASQYTKKLSATMKGMKHKKDHITITGYGSGIKQISFGFECVCNAS